LLTRDGNPQWPTSASARRGHVLYFTTSLW
jgi:hypothetical protein